MNTILTDDDRKKVFLEACGKNQFSGFDEALMILTEAAVLAKLAQQEPVVEYMGRRRTPEGTRECWGVLLCDDMQDPEKGAKLYTRPAPQQADRQRVPANKANNEFNRVIQHAITLGSEAAHFLRCWNEGNWDGCREFGFKPDLPYEIEEQSARQRVPDGWKLVPVNPTSEMLGAADREHAARGLVSIALISYRAMLAATPEAPAQAGAVDERHPLTDAQIEFIRVNEEFTLWGISESAFRYAARAIEHAHGISGEERQKHDAALAQKGGAA